MLRQLVLAVFLAGIAGEAMGEWGQVTFYAGRGTIAYCEWSGEITPWPVGSPSTIPGYGKLNIAFYSAPPGTPPKMLGEFPDLSGWWLMSTPVISKISVFPGTVPGTICQLSPDTCGQNGETQCILVAWTGDYPDFMSAVLMSSGRSMLAWTGKCGSGGSLGWRQKTGSNTMPAVLPPGVFDRLLLGAMEWQGDYPTQVVAQGGDGVVYLSWKNSWQPLTFEIRRRIVGTPDQFETIGTTTESTYIDTNVVNGVTYEYIVVTCGYTFWINKVTATPMGPQLQAAYDSGAQTFRLSWPEWATQYAAYSTTNLAPGSTWLPVTNSVQVSNGLFHVFLEPADAPTEFFQLFRSP